MHIVGLGGGIGAARLWRHLAAVVEPEHLTIVVNTADDAWMHGVRVCPDIDAVIYGLAGRRDEIRGWGLRDETFTCMATMRELGVDVWFNLGDRDLATHLLRTTWLRAGLGLSDITQRLAQLHGVRSRVRPMCEAEVETEVRTASGWIHYQEFLVHQAASVPVLEVRLRGIAKAVVPPDVATAVADASVVVIGPSNPVASVLPIVSVPGMADVVRSARAPVIAVSPVVRGVRIADAGEARRAASRARLLESIGQAHRAAAVARLYSAFVDAFVVDTADRDEAAEVASTGCEVIVAPTLTHVDPTAGSALVKAILDAAARMRTQRRP